MQTQEERQQVMACNKSAEPLCSECQLLADPLRALRSHYCRSSPTPLPQLLEIPEVTTKHKSEKLFVMPIQADVKKRKFFMAGAHEC